MKKVVRAPILDKFSQTYRYNRVSLFVCLIVLGLGLICVPYLSTLASAQSEEVRSAIVLRIDGPIGPAIADYLVDGIEDANEAQADLIILEMDTPGGLDTSMRRIIKSILASNVPVASYVSPSGARAASAGTYILYASHVAAMAPGTNLGAATPVQMGGTSPLPGQEEPAKQDKDTKSDKSTSADDGETADAEDEEAPALSNEDSMRAKVVNDATAYIKGLAELRGRNIEWAVAAVREAKSLPANEAAEKNVIDFVAKNLDDLLAQSDGRMVDVKGTETPIASKDALIERSDPDWSTRLLVAITDPNIAFMLMTLGFYGLFFELANPGSIFPGTIGLIALILGLYSLSVLPVNMAGAGLYGLGLILMVAEVFVTTGGFLASAGLVAFAVGALMLFDTKAPGFELSWQVIVGATVLTGVFFFFIIMYAMGAHARKVSAGTESILRHKGEVESWEGDEGWVILDGERWRARSKKTLAPGQEVKVLELDGLTLVVAPA